jgi:hypothetical protein
MPLDSSLAAAIQSYTAAKSGGGSRRRKTKGGISKSDAAKIAKGRFDKPEPSVPEWESQLGELGEGGENAERLYRQIQESDAPEALKREARRRFKDGESDDGGGLFDSVKDFAGDALGKTFMVLDKPKRAVVGVVDEVIEEVRGQEDGKSLRENVLEESDYGFGDVVERNIDVAREPTSALLSALTGADRDQVRESFDEAQDDSSMLWAKRLLGITGDIGLDPLTYVTGGVAKAGATGTTRAREAGRLLDEAARAADRAGDVEKATTLRAAAERVLKSNTTRAATADELGAAGLEGGIRFAGKRIPGLGQDTVGALGGRQFAAGKARVARSEAMDGLRGLIGADETRQFRSAIRGGRAADGMDAVTGLHQLDASRARGLARFRTLGDLGAELDDLMREGRRKNIDVEAVTDAIRRGADSEEFAAIDEATDGFASRWRKFFDDGYEALRREGVDVSHVDDYIARVRPKDTHEALGTTAKSGRKGRGRSFFEHRRLKAGDEFLGVKLDADTPIEAQMQRIADSVFDGEAAQLFSNDINEIGSGYLRAISNRIGDEAQMNVLRQRGVIGDILRPEVVDDIRGAIDEATAAAGRATDEAAQLQAWDNLQKLRATLDAQAAHRGAAGADAAVTQLDEAIEVLREKIAAVAPAERAKTAGSRLAQLRENAVGRAVEGGNGRMGLAASQGRLDQATQGVLGVQDEMDLADEALGRVSAEIDDRVANRADVEANLIEMGLARTPTEAKGMVDRHIKGLTRSKGTLDRQVDTVLPDKLAKRMGGRDKAAARVAGYRTEFEAARTAADDAWADFGRLSDEYEMRAAIGAQAAAELPATRATRKAQLTAASDLRREAARIIREASKRSDAFSRRIAAAEATALDAQARAFELGQSIERIEEVVAKGLRDPETQRYLKVALDDAIAKEFRFFSDLPPGHVWTTEGGSGVVGEHISAKNLDAMLRARETIINDPNALAKAYDAALRGFKTFAVLTPGYHVRNLMGGVFNNMVAGVELASYGRFTRSLEDWRAVNGLKYDMAASRKAGRPVYHPPTDIAKLSAKRQKDVELIGQVHDSGILNDMTRVAEFTENPSVSRLRDIRRTPGSGRRITDNVVTRSSRYAGDKSEDMLRGTLAFDRLAKGQSIDAAIDDVYNFHFNYGDLSSAERNVMRRIVPFWTWTSRNLQNTAFYIASNPRAFQRWNVLKDNLDGDRDSAAYKDQAGLAPDYMTGLNSIHLGGGNFATPDLPFAAAEESVRQLGNPVGMIAQDASPFLKIPLELAVGKNFFTGAPLEDELVEPPESWEKLGIVQALSAAGLIEEDKYGNPLVSSHQKYAIDQSLPLLGRVRRLAPGDGAEEEKERERQITAWLSFAGLGSRKLDERTRENEMWSRKDALQDLKDRLKARGYTVGEDR